MNNTTLHALMRRLNYSFQDARYLQQALTHRSAAKKNNERLEFLGDSLLNSTISMTLFHQFPEQSEGQLTRLRANLVKEDTLAAIAVEIQLGETLVLGQGELKSGGYRRSSILADALEAVFAAVFLDGGWLACQELILRLYHTRLSNDLVSLNHKDAKTQLQEYLQAHKQPLPEYTLLGMDENSTPALFQVGCILLSLNLRATSEGETRRKAEQSAAEKILSMLAAKKS